MLQIPEQTSAAARLSCDFCVRSLRAPSSPTVPSGLPRDLHAQHPHPGSWTLFWLSHAPSRPRLCPVSGQGWAKHSGSLSAGLPRSVKGLLVALSPLWLCPWDGTHRGHSQPWGPCSTLPPFHSWGSPAPAVPH